MDAAIKAHLIHPWCELCKAPREQWTFEVAELPGKSLSEILPELKRQEADQIATQASIKAAERAARN
jgi:hypothetical protein